MCSLGDSGARVSEWLFFKTRLLITQADLKPAVYLRIALYSGLWTALYPMSHTLRLRLPGFKSSIATDFLVCKLLINFLTLLWLNFFVYHILQISSELWRWKTYLDRKEDGVKLHHVPGAINACHTVIIIGYYWLLILAHSAGNFVFRGAGWECVWKQGFSGLIGPEFYSSFFIY